MQGRFFIAIVTALVLTALAVGPVAAGGWAEAKAEGIGGGGESGEPGGTGDAEITAGTEQRVDFSLLQHGITPVDFGTATLVATNRETGEAVRVAAESRGKGRWSATITFPTAGSWQLSVEHSDLLVSNLPIVDVATAPPVVTGPAGVAQAGMIALVGAVALLGVGLLIVSGRRLRRSRSAVTAPESEAELARA